jgi:hypothetical protein
MGSANDGEERSAAMKLMDKLQGARRNNVEWGKMVWGRMVCPQCLLQGRRRRGVDGSLKNGGRWWNSIKDSVT